MSENIKYGTDDKWHIEKYIEAESIFKDFEDCKVETIYDVSRIVSDIMIKYGPNGRTHGHQIIALILWRLLKK